MSKIVTRGFFGKIFRMRPADRELMQVVGMDNEQASLARYFDFLVVAAAFLLFCGAFHLHVMLSAGDWDMFIDWKDRQYWPLIIPIDTIMFPAAVQAAFCSAPVSTRVRGHLARARHATVLRP